MTTISRRDAFRVAADVLERSDWLATDLLADEGDENASENADRIVAILREMSALEAAEREHVPAYLQELLDAEDPSWGATSDDWDRIEADAPELLAVPAIAPPPASAEDQALAGEWLAGPGARPTPADTARWAGVFRGHVPATAPPPSGAASAPTPSYALDGPLANFGVTQDGQVVGVRDSTGAVRPEFLPPTVRNLGATPAPEPEWLAALRRQEAYRRRHEGLAGAVEGPQ